MAKAKRSRGRGEALVMLALILFTAAAFAYAGQYEQPSRISTATGKVVVQVVAPENSTQSAGAAAPLYGLAAGTRGPRWQ